jgi:hypothetical protein
VELGRAAEGVRGYAGDRARDGLVLALAWRGHLRQALEVADTAQYPWLYAEAARAGIVPRDSARRQFASWLDAAERNRGSIYPAVSAARWWVDTGDTTSLRTALRIAERAPDLGRLTDGLRSALSMARRDTADAIRRLTVPDSACLGDCPQMRLPLAKLLAAQRRDREAAAILDQEFTAPVPSRVLWMLERGRVNERLGEREKAIDAFAYVVAAWERADPELQPVVGEAREALRRLGVRG